MPTHSDPIAQQLPKSIKLALSKHPKTECVTGAILDRIKQCSDLTLTESISPTAFSKDKLPILSFSIKPSDTYFLRLIVSRRLFILFSTVTDMNRFLEYVGTDGLSYGSELTRDFPSNPFHTYMVVALDISKADENRIADALLDIAKETPTRRLVPQQSDTEIEIAIRALHRAEEVQPPEKEYHYNRCLEQLVDLIARENLDDLLDTLPQYDPRAETHPEEVLGTELIILNTLFAKRPSFADLIQKRLPYLLKRYEALDIQPSEDIDEVRMLIRDVSAFWA